MMKTKLFLLAIVANLLILSCSKENIVEEKRTNVQKPKSELFHLENGIIAFDDSLAFA